MIKRFFPGILLFAFIQSINSSPGIVDTSPFTNDTLIDAGGHKMHFVVIKAGEPTILLEAGGGDDASQWETVQRKLSTETNATIISYDRAGFGKSELPGTAYDIRKEAQDLHYCLGLLGTRKLILVAHSYGAFLTQAYQFMYPLAITAIILADPNTVPFVDSIGFAMLTRISFDTTKPLSNTQKADVRQTIAFRSTIETLREMPFSKNIPLTILSAEKDWWPLPQWNQWWKNSHQSIVSSAPNRALIIAKGSSHNVPQEQPGVIVDAIINILKGLR